MPKRDHVFVSYSHKDRASLERLKVHLRPFERDGSINIWSDQQIKASQKWRDEIQNALERTAVAILLVSADFLASDFIADEELPQLLKAAEQEGVRILPIVLSACLFQESKLQPFQAANDPDRPLLELPKSKQDRLWLELAKQTKTTLELFEAQQKAEAEAPAEAGKIKLEKVATLYWLGNDLMWIQDLAYRGGNPKRIMAGIGNAIAYIKELGIDDKEVVEGILIGLLLQLKPAARAFEDPEADAEILRSAYSQTVNVVEFVKWYIHKFVSGQQPDFVKRRVF